MHLIRYRSEFQEPMLALHRSAIEGFSLGMSQQQEEADLMAVENVYLCSGGEFLLGFLGERLVAMGGFKRLSDDVAELRRMRIARELQGQGYGTLMLRELERRAFESGIRTLCLDTARRRPLTLEFYRKHGYQETGRGFYGAVETVQFKKALDAANRGGPPDGAPAEPGNAGVGGEQATLRRPEPADYEVIGSWVPDADSCLRWAGPRVSFPFAAAELPRLLTMADGLSYCLAEGTARPLGFGQHWVVKPGAVHLGRIIVSPADRGRGLGRLLCQLLVAQAIAATGATEVTLRVYRNNAAALSLYSSLGFSTLQSQSTEDVLFMRREADPQGAANRRQRFGSETSGPPAGPAHIRSR